MSIHATATGLALCACTLVVLGSGCGTSEGERRRARTATAAPSSYPAGTRDPAVSREARVKARRGGPIRLVRPPVVFIMPTSSQPFFVVLLRFNRKLPNTRVRPLLDVRLGKQAAGDHYPSGFGRRSRHCYRDDIGNDFDDPGLRGVRAGSRVRLAIGVGAGNALTEPTRAITTIHRMVTLRRFTSKAFRAALGCEPVGASPNGSYG